MPSNIRRPLFDGTREVSALWFDVALIGEAEAHRRVLLHWQAGARLHRALGGYLLELPKARFFRCGELDAIPLCEEGGILTSAPLTKDERAVLSIGRLWLIRGARVQVYSPTQADLIDPSIWLNLHGIPILETLQMPRSNFQIPVALPEDDKSLREILKGAIPPASNKRADFLRDTEAALRDGKSTSGSGLSNAIANLLAPVALGVLGLVASWLDGIIPANKRGSANSGGDSKPSGLSPWAQKLADAAAHLAMFTRVSKLLGRKQSRYLNDLLDMFERGDIQEALRHAISLDSLSEKTNRPAFGTPRRRDSLNVGGPNQVAAQINLGNDLQQHLKKVYRQSFERLDREGKIDEAVFVLAELLKAGTEAVTYLEKHGRIKQAAELAETMELPAEIAVRLWWLAGDFKRAARLAQLRNVFGDAVRLLERNQAPEAIQLRKLWAQNLAAKGELSEAAEVIWPLPDCREIALTWLLQAERAGGILSVRALTRKLSLHPDSLGESEASIYALLNGEGEDGAQQRARLVGELINIKTHSVATKRLAAEVLRRVIPERMEGLNQLDKREIKLLIDIADSPMLKADLPNLNFQKTAPLQALSMRITALLIALEERGQLPIHDACFLPDGHYLLALGESGVIRVDRRGKQIAHYPIPAHFLVLADSGQHALALAKRDDSFRISRLDLLARKVSDWISLPLTYWAKQYDGVTWNVIFNKRLVAIDTTQDSLAITWQVADFPGEIIGFTQERQCQIVLLATSDGIEQWRYLLPSRRLNQRDSWPMPGADVWKIFPNGQAEEPSALTLIKTDDSYILKAGRLGHAMNFSIALGALQTAPEILLLDGWVLIHATEKSDTRFYVSDIRGSKIRAEIRINQANAPQIRVHDGHVLMFDRAGRLIDLDTSTSHVHTLVLN